MNITHKDITFEGILTEKDIQLVEFKAEEKLSDLFKFKLVVTCKKLISQPEKKIGQPLTVQWKVSPTEKRYFNGIITEFTYAEEENRFVYYIHLSPKLWLLQFRKNSRIFSNKYSSLIDITKQLLKEHQIDYQLKLNSHYSKNEYCVQYQESDFHFLTRLLENAGIFYYFKQQNNKHILILTDNKQDYKDFSEIKDIKLYEWQVNYHFYPNQYTVSDHDFKQPQKNYPQVMKPKMPSQDKHRMKYLIILGIMR
jgi:type VI secretion system secreted protein VgrG